jgi:hypothetical protein
MTTNRAFPDGEEHTAVRAALIAVVLLLGGALVSSTAAGILALEEQARERQDRARSWQREGLMERVAGLLRDADEDAAAAQAGANESGDVEE